MEQTEKALRDSEERFRALVMATSDIVYRMNPDWSEMRLLHGKGFLVDTEEPNRNWLQEYIHPDDQSHVMTVINEAIRTKSVFELEHRVLCVDGTLGWTLSRAIPLLDANGNIFEWFGAASDITGHKQVEEALEKLNENLECQVAERTAELEAANLELEAFNYSAAHDLRQPLNTIAIYTQAFEMQCGDKISKECSSYIRGIYDNNTRMTRLIETLLNFSRMVHTEPKRQSVDLHAMAHEVAIFLKQGDPERQVDLRIADGLPVNADADLMRVVLENLFGNAWKYTGKREQAVIEFGSTEIDGKLVYFIRDNGIGFDKMKADKLFVPFQRLPGAEAFRGFGIGLATVERIIRSHGGSIWAEGEPDKGATFYFTLAGNSPMPTT
jgi:signal transduction histidine kinase